MIKAIEGIYPHFKLSAGDKRAKEAEQKDDKKAGIENGKKDGEAQKEGGSDDAIQMDGGASNFCEALVSAYTKHGYFADLVKAAILKRELEGGFEIDDYHHYKWDHQHQRHHSHSH